MLDWAVTDCDPPLWVGVVGVVVVKRVAKKFHRGLAITPEK